jgi:hypothetical protein
MKTTMYSIGYNSNTVRQKLVDDIVKESAND